jgi:alpha-tubulin suppressor-like RCC1 family protein
MYADGLARPLSLASRTVGVTRKNIETGRAVAMDRHTTGRRFRQLRLHLAGHGRIVTPAWLTVVALLVFAGALVWVAGASAATGPGNTEPPSIKGTPEVDHQLEVTKGEWNEAIKRYEYEWQKCKEENKEEDCKEIAGAKSEAYVVAPKMVGYKLRVKVTAVNNQGGKTAVLSAMTAVVGSPVNIEPPTISGTNEAGQPEEGKKLTVTKGKWEGSSPIEKYAYQWESCSIFDEAKTCTRIDKEGTEESYAPTAELVNDHALRATVVATNSQGSESAITSYTAEVVPHIGSAAVAWGYNSPARDLLGAGYGNNFETSPVLVAYLSSPELSHIRAMASAFTKSYALLDVKGGVVRAWGASGEGDLGDGLDLHTPVHSPVPVVAQTNGEQEPKEMTGVTAIAAAFSSYTHAMALVNAPGREGEVMTWGASGLGERGNGEHSKEEKVSRNVATAVPNLNHVVAIAAGGSSDFALQEHEGKTTLKAWGESTNGRLGLGNPSGKEGQDDCIADGHIKEERYCEPNPAEVDLSMVPEGDKVTAISAGKHAAYALLSNGRVLAWGENEYGELGDGETENSNVPVYVCAPKHKCSPDGESPTEDYLTEVKEISGGENFALALLPKGEVVGWGANGNGALGGESNEPCRHELVEACQTTPKTVNVSKTVTEEVEGQIVYRLVEEPLQGVTAISAGADYSLALVNGQVYSWGLNNSGQLGDGETTGPKNCGTRTIMHGKKHTEIKTVKWCSREPTKISGLSEYDVAGIAAVDGALPSEGSYGHSFAWLGSGEGPRPLAEVRPGEEDAKKTLTVSARLSSPTEKYKVKWKEEPPSNDKYVIEAEAANELAGEEWEEVAVKVSDDRVEIKKLEKARKKAEEENDIEEVEKYTGEIRVLETEVEGLLQHVEEANKEAEKAEEIVEKEFPSKEATAFGDAKNCAEESEKCVYTLTEAEYGEKEVDGKWKKKLRDLEPGQTYEITVVRVHYTEAELKKKLEEEHFTPPQLGEKLREEEEREESEGSATIFATVPNEGT